MTDESAAGRGPSLLARLRTELRSRHYSRRTEQAYVLWTRRFVRFHGLRHPAEMGEVDVNAFLTNLAVERKVAASTQNQALAALLFLCRHVVGRNMGELGPLVRARKPERLPVVMTRQEVREVLGQMEGDTWLMASLMYGAGLRLTECLCLRVQNVDAETRTIHVRDGKGAKDRTTMLPDDWRGEAPPLRPQHPAAGGTRSRREGRAGQARLMP